MLLGGANCDLKSSKNPNARELKQLFSEYQSEKIITDYTMVAVTTDEAGEHSTSKSLTDHFSTNRTKYTVISSVVQWEIESQYSHGG